MSSHRFWKRFTNRQKQEKQSNYKRSMTNGGVTAAIPLHGVPRFFLRQKSKTGSHDADIPVLPLFRRVFTYMEFLHILFLCNIFLQLISCISNTLNQFMV